MNMNVSATTGEQWKQWEAELGGNIFHSQAWAETQRTATSRPLFFSWHDRDGQCLGLAVGVETWSSRPLVGRFLKQLAFETQPIAKEDRRDLMQTMMGQIIAHAKKKRYRKLDLESYMARVDIADLDLGDLTTNGRIEFIVDLNRTNEQMVKGLSSHHRRKLKKANKHDLELHEASTMDALREFRQLQVMSRDRRLKRGEEIGILDDSYYEILGQKYFSNQLGRIFILRSEGRPLSTAFVSIYGGKALYMYGGSSDEGFRKDAPVLLFTQIFERCRELGCTEFNLGGVPAESVDKEEASHGLYRFKSGFGGRQADCTSGHQLQPIRSEKFIHRMLKIFKSDIG